MRLLALTPVTVLLVLVSGRAAGGGTRPAVYSAAQAAAGQQALQNNAFGACTDCHTTALTGRTGADDEPPPLGSLPAGVQKTIQNARGRVPPLVGSEFMTRWASRSTRALTADFQRRFAFTLNEDMRLDLVAYILQLNGAIAGPEPLTMETDVEIGRLREPAH